jgi:ribosomal protein L29
MKTKEFKNAIKQMNVDELLMKLDEFNRMLFGIKLNRYTTHIKDYSQFEKMRRNIARLKTEICLKQQQNQKAA